MRGHVLRALIALAVVAAVEARGQVVTPVVFEDFDAVGASGLPPGWEVTNQAWELSTSAASPGSGLNNLVNAGNRAGELTLPPFDLSAATSAELRYLARRTASYDRANLRVRASVDGGTTFSMTVASAEETLPEGASVYAEIRIELPTSMLGTGNVRLRFETLGTSGSSANARIDDVTVLVSQLVLVDPAQLTLIALSGGSDEAEVVLANASAAVLQVAAPLVSGAGFSVSPTAGFSVPPGGEQTYVVRFQPQGGGSSQGTLKLNHGLGSSTVSLEGIQAGGLLGFSRDSTAATSPDSAGAIPLRLQFENEMGLQGLQFAVTWDDPDLSLTDVLPGAAVDDDAAWTITHHTAEATATVVLLGSGTNALSAGEHDPLLRLIFERQVPLEGDPQNVGVHLSDVVGALSVATGADAHVVAKSDRHTIVFVDGAANFFSPTATLELDVTHVGDTSVAAIEVHNPGGSMPLVVSAQIKDSAFLIEPAQFVVQPDSSVSVAVSFAPNDTLFGARHAFMVFHHNGASSPDSIQTFGLGVGGRGDAAVDGVVDVVDLVQALDFVLERIFPDGTQIRSADLYPFPTGDGALDVRDLTVLSHAIVNAVWPDGVAIPEEPGSAPAGSVLATASEKGTSFPIEERWTLSLKTEVPVRAFQVTVSATEIAALRSLTGMGAAGVVTLFTHEGDLVRIVSYRTDGGLFDVGNHDLLEMEPGAGGGHVRPLLAIGVDEGLKRVPLVVAGPGEGDAESEVPGDVLLLGAPYPNPVRFSGEERLRLPLAGRPSGSRGRAAVFNVLGRHVRSLGIPDHGSDLLEWDGLDQDGRKVVPGVYFVRPVGAGGPARSVVVVR